MKVVFIGTGTMVSTTRCNTSVLVDEKEHVGLHNIRARLEAMVNGELEIESTIGVGTKVLIKIPKEGLR
jgi:sensor histidine kinase YesM